MVRVAKKTQKIGNVVPILISFVTNLWKSMRSCFIRLNSRLSIPRIIESFSIGRKLGMNISETSRKNKSGESFLGLLNHEAVFFQVVLYRDDP
jgi:hypothetical protein